MPGEARNTVVTKLVELESELFALRFPASGSLYYSKDLQSYCDRVYVPIAGDGSNSGFCVDPETTLSM
jgi:hypothetical protein